MQDIHAFTGPQQFPLAVMLRRRPADPSQRRSGDRWQITGVVVSSQPAPIPSRITANFDEAQAYPDVLIEAVPMPPELYPWIESYVLAHYAPERRSPWKRHHRAEQNHESA